jgi:uncharacterized phage protein gp47/JayE
MSRVLLKSRSDIIRDLINSTVARTNLTDVNEAAILRHLLTAVGSEIFSVYGQFTNLASLFDFQTAEGDDLDERAKEILGGTLTRNAASRATGSLTFSRQTVGTVVNIPAGTICSDENGVQFTTTAVGTITIAALTSGPVQAKAVNLGSSGNIAAATSDTGVKSFASTKPPGVNAVTNDIFAGGLDRESDNDFRARIENFIQSLPRSTVQSLESIVLGITNASSGKRVTSSHVYEPPTNPGTATLYIDDGSGTLGAEITSVVFTGLEMPNGTALATGGEEFLTLPNYPLLDNVQSSIVITSNQRGALTVGTNVYVNWASGRMFFNPPLSADETITVSNYEYYSGLIKDVQLVVDGDPSNRATYPGYRAAGVDVRVLSPQVQTITIAANLTVLPGYSGTTVASAVQTEVVSYINNLGISGDVVRHEVVERVMAVPGVYNTTLLVNSTEDSIIYINDDQIARTTSGNVTIT